MYSKELDYLRSFKSLLFKILPLHPDFLSRRSEREAMELNSCLLDLRRRLTELESKQQFSYKHHDKDSNSSYASTLKLKGITGDNDVHNLQKRKLTSLSPRDFSFPPSLSSSSTSSLSCKKALPVTVSSDCSKKSPPTPSKRSLSVTCSRSPSSRSNSSSLLENHNSKRYLALRSPLKSVLDDSASFSKEFRSRSYAFTHSSIEDIKVPLQHELRIQSPGSLRYRPKYGDHGELLSTKLEGPSDHTKNKSYLDKYASRASFSPDKYELAFDNANSKSNPRKNLNGAGLSSDKAKNQLPGGQVRSQSCLRNRMGRSISSPKSDVKSSVEPYSLLGAFDLNSEDDSSITVMESCPRMGIMENSMSHSNTSENEFFLDFSHSDNMKQRATKSVRDCELRTREDSVDDYASRNNGMPLSGVGAQNTQFIRESSKWSPNSNPKESERQNAHPFQAIRSSFEEVDRILKSCSMEQELHRKPETIAANERKDTLETSFRIPFSRNLEEALQRLRNLQESGGEESETFQTKLNSSVRKLSSGKETAERQPSFSDGGSNAGIFDTKLKTGPQDAYALVCESSPCSSKRVKHFRDDGANLKLKHDKLSGRNRRLRTDEKPWKESSAGCLEGRALRQGNGTGSKAEKYVSKVGNEGASYIKPDTKRKVMFDVCTAELEISKPSRSNDDTYCEKIIPETKGVNFNIEDFNAQDCNRLKIQMMPFVGKANHKKNLDHALDGKLSFMSQAPLESQNALCSTSPSSDSCGVLPSFCYSMDMLSPPCLSSRNLPSETIPSELDAELHAYEEASSSMPQMTFCNPVYDCDSGRGNSESVARPGTFPCDTDEDQRASVFHGSASIRNHLDDYRELGSDNKSNGSFSQTGPHIVEHPDVRENGVHQKDASVIADSSKDSLQVAKLSKKMVSFQRMLDELKKTIESSSIHVQEQVDICDTRLKDIETQLSEVKKKTYSDLEDLKGYVRQQPGGKNVNCCNQSIEEKLHSKMEECYLNFRNFQKEIESWISKLEEHLRRKVEDALAICGEKYSRTIKEGIEKLEPHRILELGNPKKEMGVRLCLQENKKELELVVEEVLSKQLSHLLKTFFAEDRESHQIKNDVRYLQNENEMNLKARVEVQKHSETLSHLKRSLQNIRNEGIQVKLLADDIKKKTSLRFHDMRMSIDMLKLEAVECKNRILGLEKLISAEPNVDPRENVKNLHNLRMRPSPSKFYFSVSERS